jgi:hypothetical protein
MKTKQNREHKLKLEETKKKTLDIKLIKERNDVKF